MLQLFKAIPMVGDLIRTLAGDKEKRDQFAHSEQMAVYEQFAAEFTARAQRTWWDSLVDGFNRLPRPVMTFGMIALFVWCVRDPAGFTESMVALQAMPEMGWYLALTITSFWFGTKMIERAPKKFSLPHLPGNARPDSRSLKSQKKEGSVSDLQEGMDWRERVEKRYQYNQ